VIQASPFQCWRRFHGGNYDGTEEGLEMMKLFANRLYEYITIAPTIETRELAAEEGKVDWDVLLEFWTEFLDDLGEAIDDWRERRAERDSWEARLDSD
jgi:hypothetical protein